MKRILWPIGWMYVGGMIATVGMSFPPWWLSQTPSQVAFGIGFILLWPASLLVVILQRFGVL
jgi:hypothetical protein